MATVLITGAGRGIGLALAAAFKARGDRVIATCRGVSPALAAPGVQVEDGIDVAADDAFRRLDQRLGELRLDVLLLAAGVLSQERLGELDDAALARMRHQFEVNALGPLRAAEALRHRLGAGSKLAILTSRMGSIADNGSGGYYGYRASKAAVNAIGRSLAIDLRAQGVAVALLHPGYVRTDMTGGRGDISPEESARNLIARIDALDLAQSGGFRHASGETLPW